MKGLMKVPYGGLGIWRGIGLPRKSMYQCTGSCSVGWPRKRWIDTMKDSLRKRGSDIRQSRKMVQDRSEW